MHYNPENSKQPLTVPQSLGIWGEEPLKVKTFKNKKTVVLYRSIIDINNIEL
jgi:hypothetical protein